jgi:hypothetical protein
LLLVWFFEGIDMGGFGGLWLCGVGRTLRGKWDWSHLEDSWSSSCQIWGRAGEPRFRVWPSYVPCPLPPFVKVVCLKWSEKMNGLLGLGLRWNVVIGMSMVLFNNYSIYNNAASCFKRRSSLKGPRSSAILMSNDHRQRP